MTVSLRLTKRKQETAKSFRNTSLILSKSDGKSAAPMFGCCVTVAKKRFERSKYDVVRRYKKHLRV